MVICTANVHAAIIVLLVSMINIEHDEGPWRRWAIVG
jgi:hypothetical protein